MEEDLSTLIIRAQKNDKQAFGQIYDLFYARIYRYLKYQTGDKVAAEDICQETFLKSWKAINSFSYKKGGTFQAFLYKIARNLSIDWYRKKKELPIGERDFFAESELEEDLDKKERMNLVKRALGRLEKLDKQIVELRYFDELSFTEISHVLHIKEGALRVRIHRILNKLKGIIEETHGNRTGIN